MLICFGIGEQKNGRLYLYLKKTNKEPQDIITEIFKLAAPRYCLQPVSSFPRTGILVNEDVDIYDAKKVV
jgi:hypothetical protein